MKVEVDLKTTVLTAFKAHEFENILRKIYAWSQGGNDFKEITAWSNKQYDHTLDTADVLSNGWKYIEGHILDSNEDAYADWIHLHIYGTAWNGQADAYVREQFRKFMIALGRK